MSTPPPQFSFGDFSWICDRASLPICPALGLGDPQCYSRNIGLGSFLLFQPSVLAVGFAAIIMITIMIFNIKSKYTAVGRKEMVLFFYVYMAATILEVLLATNIISLSSNFYKYFTAAYVATITSSCVLLFLNGFVGFQWFEDGTVYSVWGFRISALLSLAATFFLSISTFLQTFGLGKHNSIILFTVFYIVNGSLLLLYVITQIVLVLTKLYDRWPLGDIFFGCIFFILGIATEYAFSNQICKFAAHYIDGMFLGSVFNLLAVMMVYKFWDSITSEDLEFAVTSGTQIWHFQNTMDYPRKEK